MRHNFRGSSDPDDWGALASHTLRQVLLKTWIMARYREAAATAGLPIIPFPQKRPHIHIASCHRKFIVISPLQQFVRGQVPSYKQAETLCEFSNQQDGDRT